MAYIQIYLIRTISKTIMKNILKTFLILLLLFTYLSSAGQQTKPKVVLVLSGGGAKGIAHIPTLQALDSLGIVPDLIIGTSMGSIIGALYACGYSGDSIAQISNTTNWKKLFSREIPISSVSNEEKSEYERHLAEFELIKGKIVQKRSIISDQNINVFFNELTYPVNDIKNFDKLPIPFKAVAVDIVNGKEVILDRGSLSFAMRSSMSIPAFFSPMEYKGILLVDGGIMNNFPTDIAKAWGADIIIGSDVGGGMEPKENLNNPITVVLQSAMLASNLKVPANKKLCDVLIDHTKYLTYSTGSFGKNKEILLEGKIATNEMLNELANLAKQLKMYPQKKVTLPIIQNKILIDTIIYKGISKNNLDLIKSRINITSNNHYTLKQINEASENALGTNLMEAISFHIIPRRKKNILEIKAIEKSDNIFKASIHFDDYSGVGLFLNYTARNILGNSSRVLLSLDISNDLRYRVQYQKTYGKKKNWWFRSDFYGEDLNALAYLNGNHVTDVTSSHIQYDNQINFNLNSFKNYVGIGTTYDWNRLEPKLDPEYSDNNFGLIYSTYRNINLYAHYIHNTLDQIFYSKNGTYFKINLATSLYNHVETQTTLDDSNIEEESNFIKFSYSFEKRFPLSDKITAIIGAKVGLTYFNDNNMDVNSVSSVGFFLGGNLQRPRNDTFVLRGLEENELIATQFSMIEISALYTPISKVYFTPHINIGIVGFNTLNNYSSNFTTPKGQWVDQQETSLLTTIGITSSYNSIMGPIDFDISWANNIGGANLFLGIGFNFNVSN